MEDTKEQLVQIMEQYNIGKKPLSKLLGWGETTVINQLRGAVPSREFAEKIHDIRENPVLFSEILEKNRDKITEVAYKKARRAIDERLLRNKSANILLYLAGCSNGDTAPYQMVATLFYSQAASLILYGKPIIDEDIVYRPKNYMPYPGVYSEILEKGIRVAKGTPSDLLNPDDCNLVSAIHKLLNGYSPNAVRTLLKDDRNALLRRHGDPAAAEGEARDSVLISLSEFQAYCLDENVSIKATDIKGFRKYFDEKLKRSRNKNKG